MAKRFKNNIDYLSALCKCKSKQRSEILKSADQQLIKVICDCCETVLSGNVPLDNKAKNRLSRHQHLLRESRLGKNKPPKSEWWVLLALLSPLLGIVGVTGLILNR